MIAAFGGIWAAIATSRGASAAFAQLELQRKPVAVLTCVREFLLQDEIHKRPPPKSVLFLAPGQIGMGLIELDQVIPTYTADGKIIEYPPLYTRCVLTNAGALAVVEVQLSLETFFYDSLNTKMTPTLQQTEKRVIRIPFLKPGEPFEFGIAQGSPKPANFKFEREATLTRIDTEKPTQVTLFVDRGVSEAELQIMNGFVRREGSAKPLH